MGKDIIAMSVKEVKRLGVVQEVVNNRITQRKAAQIVGVSERHVRRLLKRVRSEGTLGILHRSRGKPGNRRTGGEKKDTILSIYHRRYPDFGPTFACEKLEEYEDIIVNRETLRLWLLQEEGANYAWQRKKRPHRQWRERRACPGEMVQMDGSHHDWLEGRGPWLVLMGYVDDATGEVFARFYRYEGTRPALDSMYRYIEIHGVPQSIYLDNYSTYKSTKKRTIEEELLNKKSLTQFGRAMEELGVDLIYADSPEAKGRVERLFGTFQDRLVKELRLAGISTLEEANAFLKDYLPKYNRRFKKQPRNMTNMHQASPKKQELDAILSVQEKRVFQKDSTIRYKTKRYLLLNVPKRHIKKVVIEERLDGSLHIREGCEYFSYKEVDKLLTTSSLEKNERSNKTKKEKSIPSANHCWRHFRIKKPPSFIKEKGSQKEKHVEMPCHG